MRISDRQGMAAWCASLLLAWLVFPQVTTGYQRGDVVSTLLRTQHAGWRTAWTEVLRDQMPRFRVDFEGTLRCRADCVGHAQGWQP